MAETDTVAWLVQDCLKKNLMEIDSTSSLKKPDNVVWMDTTRLHTSQMMQPQYRNRHNFMIFGGFLLRSSYELAFCAAASFAHSR
jgi:acyl-coenzyme A thioesterase 9